MEEWSEPPPEPNYNEIDLEEISPDFFKHEPFKNPNEPEVDFSRLDLRVGQIRDVRTHPLLPDMVYLHLVDVGESWERLIGGRLVEYYELRELENRMIVVLYNVENSWSRGMKGKGVIMCAKDAKKRQLELLDPPSGSKAGDLIYVEGYGRGVGKKLVPPGDPRGRYHQLIDKKLIREFYDIAKDMWMDKSHRAVYKGLPFQVKGREGFITTKSLFNCPITAVDCDEKMY